MLNTAHSGFVAYDLPGTGNARVLWSTGRGNYLRNGYVVAQPGTLARSTKYASDTTPAPGDSLTYTILLKNPGETLDHVAVTDTLPSGVSYAGEAVVVLRCGRLQWRCRYLERGGVLHRTP